MRGLIIYICEIILTAVLVLLIACVCHAEKDEDGWEIGGKGPDNPPVSTAEWARYLPITVRNGQREATQREISEAKRKLWVKEIRTIRAMEKSRQRRELIAYRKASGWYGARRAGNHAYANWLLRSHMSSVYFRGGGYYGTY